MLTSCRPSRAHQAKRRSGLLSSRPSWVGGAELDVGQKFWWMDWNRMIRGAITAMRTGEPVLYDDDE